jgi:hypothetical protein
MHDLLDQVRKSKALSRWLHAQTHSAAIDVRQREAVALATLQQSLDIDDAIAILLEDRMPGPAWALARPLFESYVRGLWLLHFASDEQIEKFLDGKCPPLSKLATKIGTAPETGAAWVNAYSKNLHDLHDLTHGGVQHFRRRIADGELRPNYPKAELLNLVILCIEVQIRVGAELLTLTNNMVAMETLMSLAKELRKEGV